MPFRLGPKPMTLADLYFYFGSLQLESILKRESHAVAGKPRDAYSLARARYNAMPTPIPPKFWGCFRWTRSPMLGSTRARTFSPGISPGAAAPLELLHKFSTLSNVPAAAASGFSGLVSCP